MVSHVQHQHCHQKFTASSDFVLLFDKGTYLNTFCDTLLN